MNPEPIIEPLEVTLHRQQNIVTRRQLLRAGVDDMTMYRRTRRREWQRLLPATYLLSADSVTTEQRRIASTMYADGACQLTGLGVLHWYGFRYATATDKVHLLVPHATRLRSVNFAQIQRTHALDEHPRDGGLYVVTSPARAVIDAARATTDLTLIRAIMSEAVTGFGVSLDDLEAEIRRANRSRTGLAHRVLDEIVAGIRSAPEAEFRDLLGTSLVLPPVLWNRTLFLEDGTELPTPDGYIPDAAIALEVDSRTHHAADRDWARTLQRSNQLTAVGILVLHVTPVEIRFEEKRVLRLVERTYLRRMENPPNVRVLIGAPLSTGNVNGVPLRAPSSQEAAR